jgi:BON domain
VRMLPLTASQPPAPTPDALELRRGMRVDCQSGPFGRLEGIVLDLFTGMASELVVHVRNDLDGDVEGPTDPMGALLRVQGQRVLLPPSWATKAETVSSGVLFAPASSRLPLMATAQQVAHSLVMRDDATLTADVWRILGANPSLEPALGRVTVVVQDGTVTLRGSMPSLRQRLAAEQDVWHVPGVLALRDELIVG